MNGSEQGDFQEILEFAKHLSSRIETLESEEGRLPYALMDICSSSNLSTRVTV